MSTTLQTLCPLDKLEQAPPTILGNARAAVRRLAGDWPDWLSFDAEPLPAGMTLFASIKEARRGVHGHIGNAPLACALAVAVHGPEDPRQRLAFDRLLLTWLVTVRDGADQLVDTHADAMRAAGLSLRNALGHGLPKALVEQIMAGNAPPKAEDLIIWLQRLIAEQASADTTTGAPPAIHPLAGLERALSFVLGARAPRPRQPGSAGASGESSDPDPVPSGAGNIAPAPAAVESKPIARTEPGPSIAPPGGAPPAPRLVPRPSVGPVHRSRASSLDAPSLGRVAPFTRRLQRAQAQTLRLSRPNLLGQTEGEVLRQHLRDAPVEARVVVAAALYLGEHFNAVASITVLDQMPTTPAGMDGAAWLRGPVPALILRNHVNDNLPGSVGEIDAPALATHLWLPLDSRLPGAAGLIAWAQHRPAGAPLLEPDMIGAADAWLKAVRRKAHLSITLRRLTQQLGREMTHVTGDRLLGHLIGPPPLASHLLARMAYRQYPVSVVAEAYARASWQLGAIFGHAGTHDLTPLPPEVLQDVVVGSRRAPPPEALSDWAKSLRGAIPPTRRGRLSWPFLREFHNAYMTYVLTGCLFTGGVRITAPGFATAGVVGHLETRDSADPLPAIRLVDDKARRRRDEGASETDERADADGTHNVRVVPATPEQCRQARWWHRHLAVVAKQVEGRLPTWPWLGPTPGRVQAMPPALWEAMARPPVAPNAGRHFLATHLLLAQIPADRVNQFLGHASLGEETGNPWSAAEPRATTQEMETWRAIEARMGFIPVEGLGRG